MSCPRKRHRDLLPVGDRSAQTKAFSFLTRATEQRGRLGITYRGKPPNTQWVPSKEGVRAIPPPHRMPRAQPRRSTTTRPRSPRHGQFVDGVVSKDSSILPRVLSPTQTVAIGKSWWTNTSPHSPFFFVLLEAPVRRALLVLSVGHP